MHAPSAILAIAFSLCLSSSAAPFNIVEVPTFAQERPGYPVEGAAPPLEGSPEVPFLEGPETWRPELETPPTFTPEGSPPPEGEIQPERQDAARSPPPPPPEGDAPPDSNEIPEYRAAGRPPIDPKHRHAGFWDSFDPNVPEKDDAQTTRIYYTAKYTEGGIKNQGGSRNIAATIHGSNEQFIIDNMRKWSGNALEAKRSKTNPRIIVVSPVKPVKTVNEAIEANKWAKNLVQSNTKGNRKGPKL
ncbi:hypothetical protein MGU_03681 [Metarhizium guizhouense ARSEF 977]|uniref:Uncharacterized protein n=1 Tax=Metarhizium guizhouense (strain ARSEF 977) TaxID=1276136 RepID=A0A0B4I8D1_METGA|nr:hypothetical protein MGU_03681 [Metarhizium guizhouense ARSEF 977]